MNLLLDIGNSRLKWACSTGEQLSHHGAVVRDEKIFSALAETWRQWPRPQRIVASNVAGDEFAKRLYDWVKEYWNLGVEYVAVEQGLHGLEIAYPQPQLFGVDRWVALVAARHLYPGTLCVIDSGTAVTIDVVNESGKHLGGVIVPGLALMRSTLLQRSSGVSRGIESATASAHMLLGCDTRSGVERGALYAVAGAITHTLAKIKAELAQPITTIITGGDAEAVLNETAAKYHHLPHLVLHGLQRLVDR